MDVPAAPTSTSEQSLCKALSITAVSSLSERFSGILGLADSTLMRSSRLLMLLDAGSFIVFDSSLGTVIVYVILHF